MKCPECFLPMLVPPTLMMWWVASSGMGLTTASDMSMTFLPMTNFTTRSFPSTVFCIGRVPRISRLAPAIIKAVPSIVIVIMLMFFIFLISISQL